MAQQHPVRADFAQILVKAVGDLLYRMDGVAVAGQSRQLDTVLIEERAPLAELSLVGKEHLGVAVVFSGIAARADLDGVDSQIAHDGESLLKTLFCIKIGKNTKFHSFQSFLGLCGSEIVYGA